MFRSDRKENEQPVQLVCVLCPWRAPHLLAGPVRNVPCPVCGGDTMEEDELRDQKERAEREREEEETVEDLRRKIRDLERQTALLAERVVLAERGEAAARAHLAEAMDILRRRA